MSSKDIDDTMRIRFYASEQTQNRFLVEKDPDGIVTVYSYHTRL